MSNAAERVAKLRKLVDYTIETAREIETANGHTAAGRIRTEKAISQLFCESAVEAIDILMFDRLPQ